MAAGDITASAPVICNGEVELEAAVEALNLALATDFIIITPVSGRDRQWIVFKAERAAA
jgi:hypothetical protein